MGTTKWGKGMKLMAVADRAGVPLAVHTAAAPPHEVTRVPETLAATVTTALPVRLIGDKADDRDPLDVALAKAGIELIAPHRGNRKKPAAQDGRPRRHDRRRGTIARLFAWLQNFRRLLVRHAYHAENFLGLVHLGGIVMLLRCYL
jgi:transposase